MSIDLIARCLALNIKPSAIDATNSPTSGYFLTYDGSDFEWMAITSGLDYKGSWNADTNTPAIVSSTGTAGDFYKVSVAGTTTIDGVSVWEIGDQILFNGTIWQRVPALDEDIDTVKIVTNTYQVLDTDDTVICNKATAFTVTLPVGVVGAKFNIKNIGLGTVSVVGTGSDTIDGQSTITLDTWENLTTQCYTANKWVIL